MTQVYSVVIPNVQSTTGLVTQLYPPFLTAGTGASSSGTLRRQPTDGCLERIDINPTSAAGGYIELYDVAGLTIGGSNNVDTGITMTDAYVQAEIAANRGALIWRMDFKGDSGLTTKTWQKHVPIMFGLAVRYVNTAGADGTANINLNVVVDGTFRKIEISG